MNSKIRKQQQDYLDKFDVQEETFRKRFVNLVNSEGEEISKAKKAAYFCVAATLGFKQPFYDCVTDSGYVYPEYMGEDGCYSIPGCTIANFMYRCDGRKYNAFHYNKIPSDILVEFLSTVEYAVDCCADGKEAEDMIAIAEYINEIVEWLVKD